MQTRGTRSTRGASKGFTLGEVIIALAIGFIAILGAVSIISLNRGITSTARRERLATWHAVSKMEELKALPYAQVVPSATPDDLTQQIGVPASRSWQVTPVLSDSVRQVTVVVTWSGNTIVLTSYVAKK